MKKKIAFIVPYPFDLAPSQRFRFEQYIDTLKQNEYEIAIFSFFTPNAYKLIYQPGKLLIKSWSVFIAFMKRFLLMFQLNQYSIIFIHREASPLGPPVFEWVIAKILKKQIVYDFDDAIWLENTSQSNQLISSLKRHSKVESICRWSTLIMCGNHFLMDFAKSHNKNVVYMPTTIDVENVHNEIKEHNSDKIVVGWTGTHSTIKYLYQIEDVLYGLQKELNFEFRVISNQEPEFKKIKYSYFPWKKDQEIRDLLTFDIGIMPLVDDQWAKGKCGFKALQYMSLGIPCIVSAVGVNNTLVEDGVNGFLTKNKLDWRVTILILIKDKELRVKVGEGGRRTVIKDYSVSSTKAKYLSEFEKLIKK
jgi:glycosyltransferase involved in cell wall biosynthesis